MALYASEQDIPISAWDAEKKGVYKCLQCFGPVKARKGRNRLPHFYHLAPSPSCRLYSKSEDHLLLQLQIQKDFPHGEILMEKPLLKINRVADLLWEKKKIAFEIQCSLLSLPEAEWRTKEYKTAGYEIVWILDDRIFNKKKLRPAETFLRDRLSFFASFHRYSRSDVYDQFEFFLQGKRIKKGKKIPIDLTKIHPTPPTEWPNELPRQIGKRIAHSVWYFERDLIHRTLLSKRGFFKSSLQNWVALETLSEQKRTQAKTFFHRFIWDLYIAALEGLLKKLALKPEKKRRVDSRGQKQFGKTDENGKREKDPVCEIKS